jgi:hypothetical protein
MLSITKRIIITFVFVLSFVTLNGLSSGVSQESISNTKSAYDYFLESLTDELDLNNISNSNKKKYPGTIKHSNKAHVPESKESTKLKSDDYWRDIERRYPGTTRRLEKDQYNNSASVLYPILFLLLVVLVYFVLGYYLSRKNKLIKVILWLVIGTVDFVMLILILFTEIGLVYKTVNNSEIQIVDFSLVLLFFILNIPLLFNNILIKLAKQDKIKLSELQVNSKLLLIIGICLLMLYLMKIHFFPTLALFLIVFSIYVYIYRRRRFTGSL